MASMDDVNADIDAGAHQLLLAAADHDIERLRTLLRSVSPNVRDATTGYTALHAAIASCVLDQPKSVRQQAQTETNSPKTSMGRGNDEPRPQAEEALKLLFQNGAIWNDLDNNNETPGCIAWRLELNNLYEIVVDAGVRAELLLNRLDAYAPLDDASEEEDDNGDDDDDDGALDKSEIQPKLLTKASEALLEQENEREECSSKIQPVGEESTTNEYYLRSSLNFSDDRILDSDCNGVMMSWEADIMRQTADLLLPRPGLSILNVGHGMGIFDRMVQEHSVASHHIVEAHPAVLSRMRESGWMHSPEDINPSSGEFENVTVHAGRWQDVLPRLQAENQLFDAIFFDTFAESYDSFRDFVNEHVIALLNPRGVWSFFHGLGADRQVCYSVYTKVAEIDLFEAGFDVEWKHVDTEKDLRRNEWHSVRHRYWACDKYLLPVCRFVE